MSITRIDGSIFDKMLKAGLAGVRSIEEKLNVLNVFPVADGDTGANMCLTLESGLREAYITEDLGAYLRAVSEGMLYGARGNSGVILSQLFCGFAKSLQGKKEADGEDLKNAFRCAYETAYSSVVCPVEGTILTVAREGIENISANVTADTSAEALLSMYLGEMQKSLLRTPQLLTELKAANVVDSGAMGYIAIVEGMCKGLRGEEVEAVSIVERRETVDMSRFDENSEFSEGYCMEFILQRLKSGAYDQNFNLSEYIAQLGKFGSSLVAVENGMRVKIHIHTKIPAPIMELSGKYGEFLTFKLENMQLQHNEQVSAKAEICVPVKLLATADGEGFEELFASNGCEILHGNLTEEDFAAAFEKTCAETVVVLPNGKENTIAAENAAKNCGDKNIVVLPTRNTIEGYFALALDVPDAEDTEFRIRQMGSGTEGLDTVSVEFEDGKYTAKINGETEFCGEDLLNTVENILNSEELEDKGVCVFFRGKDASSDDEDSITEMICEKFPDIEFSFIYGGQSTAHWFIGLF